MSGSLPRVSEPGEAHYEVSSIEVSPPDPLRPQGQALVAVTRTAPVCINNFQNGCAHIIEDHIDTEGLKPPQRPKYLLSSSLPEGATDYCADYRTSAVTEDSNLPSEMSDTVGSDPSLDDKFKELDLEASGEDKIAAGKGLSRKRRTKSLYGVSPNCKFGPKASVMKNQANVLTIQDPGSQRLTWYKSPLTVLIIKKILDEQVIQPFFDLSLWLLKVKQMVVFVEAKVLEEDLVVGHRQFKDIKGKLCSFKEGVDDLTDKIDLIICLGGDGTLLYASTLFQQSVPPIMAFHLGSLGFLSPFEFDDFKSKVTTVLQGNVPLSLRTRLKCVIAKKGPDCDQLDDAPFKHVESKQNILVLNEVVVDRGCMPYLGNLDLYIEHKYITSVQGDGLIISTPTGSTAYAAAAGASMVHPNVPAIVIAPICPHSLSFRPIVVPAGVEIKLMVSPNARSDAWVSFDGRNRLQLSKGDVLKISTSIFPIPSICNEDQISDWFDSLGRCLHWNVRKPQKAFSHAPSSESLLSDSDNGR